MDPRHAPVTAAPISGDDTAIQKGGKYSMQSMFSGLLRDLCSSSKVRSSFNCLKEDTKNDDCFDDFKVANTL